MSDMTKVPDRFPDLKINAAGAFPERENVRVYQSENGSVLLTTAGIYTGAFDDWKALRDWIAMQLALLPESSITTAYRNILPQIDEHKPVFTLLDEAGDATFIQCWTAEEAACHYSDTVAVFEGRILPTLDGDDIRELRD